jgi:hypothetical protein
MSQEGEVGIEEAFAAAIRGSKAAAVGKWTPVEYWLTKMDHDNGDYALTPGKLLHKLKGDLNRELGLSPVDKAKYGSKITSILSSHKKIKVNNGKKTKKIHFLFLATKQKQPPSWSTLDEWQENYNSFVERRQTHQLRVERRRSSIEEQILPVTTMPIVEEAEQSARPVTPTGEPIDSDIKALLEPFIDLDGVNDLKTNRGGNRGLRAALKAFGCRLQWTDNEAVAKAKRDGEDLTLEAVGSHRTFLDRHCCPPRKSCIQAFIALATMIDKEQPTVDIFQLKKAGGSKGSGTKLVPIIPTVATELYYRRNTKQWLRRVLDASLVGADSNQYHASFLLLKALKKLEPKAFDDVWRTAKKQSFKMDIHRQMAMAKEANMPYSQLRVIRPFFIADSCNTLFPAGSTSSPVTS